MLTQKNFIMLEKDLQKSREFKNLCKVFAEMKRSEDVRDFLRDVCTLFEVKAMSERLEAARMIQKGISYREINQKTGTSTATITRVAWWLHHGCGGYLKALGLFK
jgi:TrpR-related protein YerC/YecD